MKHAQYVAGYAQGHVDGYDIALLDVLEKLELEVESNHILELVKGLRCP